MLVERHVTLDDRQGFRAFEGDRVLVITDRGEEVAGIITRIVANGIELKVKDQVDRRFIPTKWVDYIRKEN